MASTSKTVSAGVQSKQDSKKESHDIGWFSSSEQAYRLGRSVGWQGYQSMDRQRMNKRVFMAGVSSGYRGARKYNKKGKVPKWARK